MINSIDDRLDIYYTLSSGFRSILWGSKYSQGSTVRILNREPAKA